MPPKAGRLAVREMVLRVPIVVLITSSAEKEKQLVSGDEER